MTWDTASRLYPIEMFMQPAQANRLHVYSTLYVSVSFYEKNNLAMLLVKKKKPSYQLFYVTYCMHR